MELENITIEKHSAKDMNKLYKSLIALPPRDKWIDKVSAKEIPLKAKYDGKLTEIIATYNQKISIDPGKFKIKKICFNSDSVLFKYKGNDYIFRSKRSQQK